MRAMKTRSTPIMRVLALNGRAGRCRPRMDMARLLGACCSAGSEFFRLLDPVLNFGTPTYHIDLSGQIVYVGAGEIAHGADAYFLQPGRISRADTVDVEHRAPAAIGAYVPRTSRGRSLCDFTLGALLGTGTGTDVGVGRSGSRERRCGGCYGFGGGHVDL